MRLCVKNSPEVRRLTACNANRPVEAARRLCPCVTCQGRFIWAYGSVRYCSHQYFVGLSTAGPAERCKDGEGGVEWQHGGHAVNNVACPSKQCKRAPSSASCPDSRHLRLQRDITLHRGPASRDHLLVFQRSQCVAAVTKICTCGRFRGSSRKRSRTGSPRLVPFAILCLWIAVTIAATEPHQHCAPI
jgi:hypothetical protein